MRHTTVEQLPRCRDGQNLNEPCEWCQQKLWVKVWRMPSSNSRQGHGELCFWGVRLQQQGQHSYQQRPGWLLHSDHCRST